jgi:serine/threonine-protein kinase
MLPLVGAPRILDGKYRLDERLGEGASGVVYRATHLDLKKPFALKLLKPLPSRDRFSVARFRREAEALGRLAHPNIVTVTDFGFDLDAGAPYLVMELLEGSSLAKLVESAGPLPFDRALAILTEIATAADAAHAQGILHRDLKPGNVFLCERKEGEEAVKVLDFGLAEILAPPSLETPASDPGEAPEPEPDVHDLAAARLTATGDLLGTPLYVAPEVIRQAGAGRAADIYSFGAIAYEMLVGRPPFEGSTAEVLAGHLAKEPAPPEGALSGEMWSALRVALAKDPAHRPTSALEVVRRLWQAAGRERMAQWRRTEIPRRILLATLLAAAVPIVGLLLPSSGLPVVERWTYDLRLRLAPSRPPDPRILLVTLDEASLAASSGPGADRVDEIGMTLDRLFAAGARGIAIDLLLPAPWSRSRGFSDLVLRHPDALILAAFSAPDGSVLGTSSVAGLTTAALGEERAQALFGFVNLDDDPDGVVRHGRLHFLDRSGGRRPSWAARAAEMLSPIPSLSNMERFWIDYRIDPSRFAQISWRDLPAALAKRPEIFRGRLVLVGGDVVAAGDDVHRVPRRPGQAEMVSGFAVQALLVNTLTARLPLREARTAPYLLGAALWAGLAAAAALLAHRLRLILGGLLTVPVLYLALSLPIFQKTGLLLPMTMPVLLALGALLLAVILRQSLPSQPMLEVEP